ncbi:MAG: DUF503 domain-containing protein [Deltaproteobacteria bacterium]|nr:DUF503 domain-containing protein [Deltaproteobacteria bacterium]
MVLGYGKITFKLHDCHSLKEKRKIVKSIVSKTKNRFNASVAEVALNDIHDRAQIGFSMTGNDRRKMDSGIDGLMRFVESIGLAEIIGEETEILNI